MATQSSRPSSRTSPAREPAGVNGKLVLVLLMIVSVASVVLGFVFIRPPEGFEPAPIEQRPFGPAGYSDASEQPLIDKGIAAERKRELTGEAPPQPERPAQDAADE